MTSATREGPLPRTGRIAPVQCALVATSAGSSSESGKESARDEWQRQSQSLQQLICELLIRNQQLRMTLMEMKASEPALRSSCNG
jgi:hypothetical protein